MPQHASTHQPPPAFLQLAGHPVRWGLLRELANTDLQVRELGALIGARQNLISYHLGKLRTARLVKMRRSSADARDAYYSLDLARCRELLAASGAALHPALALEPRSAAPGSSAIVPSVLFICTGNSARSQMAEALFSQMARMPVQAVSAGSHPKPLHPNAVRVLAERGIDISGRKPKHFGEFAETRFDYIITLCDRVREICPEFPGHPRVIHWSLADPAGDGGSDEETYPAFQQLASELEVRIEFLIELIKDDLISDERN